MFVKTCSCIWEVALTVLLKSSIEPVGLDLSHEPSEILVKTYEAIRRCLFLETVCIMRFEIEQLCIKHVNESCCMKERLENTRRDEINLSLCSLLLV